MKVSILDLTARQTARIEREVGYPVNQWDKAPKGDLFPLILSTVNGDDAERYRDLPLRDLVDMVALDADENP